LYFFVQLIHYIVFSFLDKKRLLAKFFPSSGKHPKFREHGVSVWKVDSGFRFEANAVLSDKVIQGMLEKKGRDYEMIGLSSGVIEPERKIPIPVTSILGRSITREEGKVLKEKGFLENRYEWNEKDIAKMGNFLKNMNKNKSKSYVAQVEHRKEKGQKADNHMGFYPISFMMTQRPLLINNLIIQSFQMSVQRLPGYPE